MSEFKSRGKYYPRSILFNMAQEYWMGQFYETIRKAAGWTYVDGTLTPPAEATA